MSPSDYVAKLKIEMESIKEAMADPGAPDFTKYREMVSRYQALKWAKLQLKITTDEEDQ